MKATFILSKATKIEAKEPASIAVKKAINLLERDIQNVITTKQQENKIQVILTETLPLDKEIFQNTFSNCGSTMEIQAKDELGLIYGLLFISRQYLEIQPFWFWDCQPIKKVSHVEIPPVTYTSSPFKVAFRGWFVNDEVLLMGWKAKPHDKTVWEAVFEALLRCGGNMVIPGTDENSRCNRQLAADMGLWITQHHAEPLGAEMFARRYPDKTASYLKHPKLFETLWREAIDQQKNFKTIWNLGFRGQGDRAFWADDPSFTEAKSRGALISEIMAKQYELIEQFVENPVFCTNLYGEIMELYQQGYIQPPEQVIKIWADSGYGKMVSRRQGNYNPRVPALPKKTDVGPHGLYYHVTFYDLQASNHLTMLPNGPEFVVAELKKALQCQVDQLFIINCGNVLPHTYLLDLVSQIWSTGEVKVTDHLIHYLSQRYTTHVAEISEIYQQYFQCPLKYGHYEDEKAGEQYYHYAIRNMIHHWLKHQNPETNHRLIWLTGDITFMEQVQWILEQTTSIRTKWDNLYQKAVTVKEQLTQPEQTYFSNSLLLQIILHDTGCRGLIEACESYLEYVQGNYRKAFMRAMTGKVAIETGLRAMEKAQQGAWENYYRNDCLTNVELTAECIDTWVKYLRLIGDGPSFYQWEKKYLFEDSEKTVELVTNFSKPLTNQELSTKLKKVGIKP